MNEVDALRLVEDAVWAVVIGGGPSVVAATAVGLVVALIQALTQIQEATLTFVPKILVIFVTMLLFAPLAASQLVLLADESFSRIESGF